MQWLGLDWDEGPVLQSERFDDYRAAAEDLLARGLAYECYCTSEELKARNEQAQTAGRPPGYDGQCRDLTPEQRAELAAEGRPRSVRFRTPDDGVSHFVDAIRGDVSVEWSSIPDFVIVRSDGNPIFFLANAVDDLAMSITHVIRGEDLLDSTHRVLALRAALGSREPLVYAHLPLILAPDRSKLSKRHGAIALEEFREAGYLREAICNYLSLLGWAPADGREVMAVDEIVAAFDLDGVTHAAAAFDHKKLDWINGEWMRRLTLDDLEERASPFAAARYGEDLDRSVFREALRIGQERAVTLVSLVDQMDFLFVGDAKFKTDEDSWSKLAATDRVGEILDAIAAHLESCDWPSDHLDVRPVLEPLGVKPGKVMHAIYTAVEGRKAGLPLFESIVLLGRERSLARVRAARARLGG
jgi:glutamyl-tRNA synthetase